MQNCNITINNHNVNYTDKLFSMTIQIPYLQNFKGSTYPQFMALCISVKLKLQNTMQLCSRWRSNAEHNRQS
jgi:hypothetical protein